MFDSDADFEILIKAGEEIKVIEENGLAIFSEPGYGFLYNTFSGPKLVIWNFQTESTKIYSLPGTVYQNIEGLNQRTEILTYPNPATNYIVIQNLKPGEMIQIFDMNGLPIANYKIDCNH